MSLLKTGAVQVGKSGSASNNFHWRNLLDGLLRLSRGNAGSLPAGNNAADVMRVKADNSVEFPGGVASGVLGAGQTWQDVKVSRAADTTYTNTTGKPIEVVVVYSGTIAQLELQVDGSTIWRQFSAVASGAIYQGARVLVPAGSTYRVTGTSGTLFSWRELR